MAERPQQQQPHQVIIQQKSGGLSTILKLLLILLLLVVLAPVLCAILFGGCGIVACLGLGGVAVLEVAEEEAARERQEQAQENRKESLVTIAAEIQTIEARFEEIKRLHAEKGKEFDRLNACGDYEKANKIKDSQLELNTEYANLEAKKVRLMKQIEHAKAKIEKAEAEKAQEKAEKEPEPEASVL